MWRREDQPEFQPSEDYVLRMASQLGTFLQRIAGLREAKQVEQAFVVALQAQEKLFGVPVAVFGQWDLEAQVGRLVAGLPPAEALERCLAYSHLLEEMARLYEARGAPPLASVTRQLAGQFVTQAGQHFPDPIHAAALQQRAVEIAANLGNDGGSEVVA